MDSTAFVQSELQVELYSCQFLNIDPKLNQYFFFLYWEKYAQSFGEIIYD